MYKLEFFPEVKDEKYREQIWDILCECDKEFVPPLSSRNDTKQKNFLGTQKEGNITIEDNKPVEYFNNLIQQHFIIALDINGDVAGFLSFKIDHDALDRIRKNIYMSTACIRKIDRGKKLSGKLYKFVESELLEEYKRELILTRTWSTNEKQMHIFKKLGYEIIETLPNDRGDGIDTVYFLKSLE